MAPTPNLFLLLPSGTASVQKPQDKFGCLCCFCGPEGFAGSCLRSLGWRSQSHLLNHFLQTDLYVICFYKIFSLVFACLILLDLCLHLIPLCSQSRCCVIRCRKHDVFTLIYIYHVFKRTKKFHFAAKHLKLVS